MTDQRESRPWHGSLAPADWVPTVIDTSQAHPARIYDFLLGGKDNYAADRAVAEQLMVVRPELREIMRANRAFLGRAVRFAVDSGIRQFLDIGTGIPTAGNTHQVAQAVAPDATVAYVDNDPLVLVHARALMAAEGHGRTTIHQGDLRDPRAILASDAVRTAIDFDRPVALLLVAILHFIGDEDDPAGIVATLREALAPGSVIVISHATYSPERMEDLERFTNQYNKSSADLFIRHRDEVEGFFDGFDLVDPGLVMVTDWRPDADTVPLPAEARARGGMQGGVGVLRAT